MNYEEKDVCSRKNIFLYNMRERGTLVRGREVVIGKRKLKVKLGRRKKSALCIVYNIEVEPASLYHLPNL